ncbi:MAG: hypothetical protein KJO54_04050 [Gammaproteobacteria bacterium]|nr:hypothetical protein [Gammaproteobacteria bacterium]NNF61154.1 hypothetical protein [Gammaproteobacteria bacterium]NNM19756.1 hypothetical protein [Gammaproteobacteria bacterium]
MTLHAKSLVFVHGHHYKPDAGTLDELWNDALRWGIERDFPKKLAAYDDLNRRMAYYGDLSNALLGGEYDEALDVADRRNALVKLQEIPKPKKFKRYTYEQLPGKSALKEALADIGSPVLGKVGLEKKLIEKISPELAEYWSDTGGLQQTARARVHEILDEVLRDSVKVMVISHCLGAVITYDVLWGLSQAGREEKVDRLFTLGCALGNRTVQKNLAGADRSGKDCYPSNILAWTNLAAEDDFICHDKTVADDFNAMLKQQQISSIDDFRIYNLTVRYGKSNPHSSVGYLIHPRLTKLVADWL